MVEVMVALGVLTIGVLGATAAQVSSIKLSNASKSNGLALSLAEAQMEEFQSTTMADLIAMPAVANDPGNPIMVDPGGGTTVAFSRDWIIEANTPEAGMARITVNVDWIDAVGGVQTARVQSLKATW